MDRNALLAEMIEYLNIEEEISDEYPFRKRVDEITPQEWTSMLDKLMNVSQDDLSGDNMYSILVETIGLN